MRGKWVSIDVLTKLTAALRYDGSYHSAWQVYGFGSNTFCDRPGATRVDSDGLIRFWLPGHRAIRSRSLAVLAVSTLVAGCANQHTEPYPTLTGRFAAEAATEPLLADYGELGPSGFRLRFRQGEQVFEGGGRMTMPPSDEQTGLSADGPFLVPLEYWNPVDPDTVAGNESPARVLGVSDWQEVRSRLFESVVPVDAFEGVVVHFGVDDYFLFYDENRQIHVSVIDEKPGDYRIAARYAFAELLQKGFPVLDRFLEERRISEPLLLLNTGDTGAYALPFLFVDRDRSLAAFVKLGSASRDYIAGSPGDAMLQGAGHVVTSHTLMMISRPFSSALRLVFLATDTVGETLRSEPVGPVDPDDIPPLYDGPGMDLNEWEAELDRLSGSKKTRGTIRYLIDGEDFFTRFIDAVSAAQESISLRMYIFDNDDYALRMADMLKRRSNEGIRTKVLLDGLGTIVSLVEEQESLPEGHVGPSSMPFYLADGSDIRVRMAANPWLTGDHVKTVVIDKKLAFTGGMNIAREYRYDWHDMMIELEGPVVDRIQFEFDKAWAHAGLLGDVSYFFRRIGPRPKNADDVGDPMRLLFTRADQPQIFLAQQRAAKRAKKYIYVQNAYFTDDAMLYELAKARLRGVDVRVIMPLITDRGPITKNNALAANALLEHGVRVYIYPGMSHVKAAVFDGWACLGSANLDRWSLRLNRELNIATSEPVAVRELEESLFEVDFQRSVELTEPFPERWSDFLLELVGDYLF